jgi:hypothetical protein
MFQTSENEEKHAERQAHQGADDPTALHNFVRRRLEIPRGFFCLTDTIY